MESKKFMLGDEPRSYPPAPPSQVAHGHEEQRTTSPLLSKGLCNVATESTRTNNSSGKRPTRHVAKRRSSGTRFMKRSTSMEDTSKARMRRSPSHQRLQTFSPMPAMTQNSSDSTNSLEHHEHDDQQSPLSPPPRRLVSSRNDSNSSTFSNRTAPSSFIVSSMECAKPIEQTFHATGKSLSPRSPIDVLDVATTKNNQPLCSSATKALRYVSASSSSSNIHQANKSITSSKRNHQRLQKDYQDGDHSYQRSRLVSHFVQQQNSGNNLDDDSSYQKMMDDQYRDIQHHYHPMLASLMRCLAAKLNHNNCRQASPPKSATTPKTHLPSSSSSAFFVPATSSSESTGIRHHRHHSHAGDATNGGRHIQHQQLQQQQQLQSIHADQRQVIHKNHMKKVLLYNDMQQHNHHHHHLLGAGQSSATQHGPSIVSSDLISPVKRSFALSMASSSSASTSSPWVTSIWDRVWNGLIKA